MLGKMTLCAVRNQIFRKSICTPARHICLFCNEYHKTPYKIQIPLSRKLSNTVSSSTQSKEELEPSKHYNKHKIIYNSLTHRFGFLTRKKMERQEKLHKKRMEAAMEYTPVSLKYLLNNDENVGCTTPDTDKDSSNDSEESSSYFLNLPYRKSVRDNIFINKNDKLPENSEAINENVDCHDLITDYPSKYIGKWMNDYEKYSEEEPEGTELSFWQNNYGTPDSSVPVSEVPCGGCGALLHCQDHSIPGYLPSEIFKNCDVKDLRETVCQRCHFLKNYNTALSVTVKPEDYPKMISHIRDKRALVLLITDMTDLPCSIWPGILDIIGPTQPLFLVGNKVDLIPGDRKGWLREAQSYLRSCFPKNAVVHFTSLISAKTGFGVEELINKLHNFWQYKGDVYLIGCTNVGKSTLFNALLQSDYCKVKAVDLVQRATTAPWPGTTLNLLKFPILRPDGWRLYLRTQRLIKNRKSIAAERKLRNEQKVLDKREHPQLIGHIGRTFIRKRPEKEVQSIDNFSTGKPERFGLDPNDPDFARSKWVFDTPGVLTKEQFLDLLTTDEVSLTVPKEVIIPRTFIMKVGWSLFIAGLARMDYLKGEQDIKVTIFSANTLPVTILHQEHAEELYKELLGSELLQVPQGPEERLKAWPGLEMAKEINFIGIHGEEACADVSLSSAGWASITPYEKEIVKLSFWTPEGRGVHARTPLLPKAVSLRGKKLNKVPAYGRSRPSLAAYREY